MTSSPGSTAASIAAIIASVAPHETVTSVSGSMPRPHAADVLRAIAARRVGAPHVVAYWLKPSRSAATAASRILGSGSKSGKPCAKLTAFSGPLSCKLSRVISRMTDSVKLWAFSESRSVSRIGTLQAKLRAGARVASRRPLEAALPPPAHRARPARRGEEIEHVGPAEEADHLAAPDHGDAPDALADQEPRRLVDPGLLCDRDHTRAHDLARRLALLGEDVRLGHDPHDVAFARDHRRARDALGDERRRDLLDRRVLAKRDHVPRHHLFDRDHEGLSSVATV